MVAFARMKKAGTVLMAAALPFASSDLQGIKLELGALGLEIRSLTEADTKAVELAGARPLAERFANAEMVYLLGDYERAALLLHALVTDRAAQGASFYPKAVFYLAESQYQIGNSSAAEAQLLHIVTRRYREHLPLAVRRLIEVGERTGRWEAIDEALARLQESGGISPEVAYALGRSQLQRKKPEQARAVLAAVPKEHRLAAKAQLLRAVASVALGRHDVAATELAAVLALKGAYDDLSMVQELASLNRGRLHLEHGRFREAASDYQRVSRKSPRFDESLYEVTWAHVEQASVASSEQERREALRRARNSLEILLLVDDDNPVTAEARLLLGNVLLRMGDLDQAEDVFGDVARRFSPTRDALLALEKSMSDPASYYDVLVGRAEGAGALPPLARRWVDLAEKLEVAGAVSSALLESEKSLAKMHALADKLEAAINTDLGSRLFPPLQGAILRRVELSSSLAAVTERLQDIERAALRAHFTPAESAALEAVLGERAKIAPAYRALPKNREQQEARMQSAEQRLLRLQRGGYQLRYPLQSMRAGLAAVRSWLLDRSTSLREEDKDSLRQRIELTALEIEELTRAQAELEQRLERERAMQLAGDPAALHDREVRARYEATLEREREILARVSPLAKANGSEQVKQMLGEFERLRLVAGGYAVELASFSERTDNLASSKLDDVRRRIEREAMLVPTFREETLNFKQEARRVIGDVVAAAVAEVREQFAQLVLRAEVGVIDVAWQRKEHDLNTVARLTGERRRDLSELEANFQGLLDDE